MFGTDRLARREKASADGGGFPMRIRPDGIALALALSEVVGTARGDVFVTGTLDHLHIEAKQARIVEVLDALKRQFGLACQVRVRSDWTVDGAFSGSLATILPRIFRGANYVYRTSADDSVTVFFLSPPGSAPDLPIPQPPVAAVMIGGDDAVGRPVRPSNPTRPLRN